MTQEQPTITEAYSSLTKHPEGSVRELWTLAYPMMLSIMSGNLMMFLDRLILANYSTDAMNAAAIAGMVVAVVQFGAIAVASIAEVFVGRYNGSKQPEKAGIPVWQMLWFSLITSVIFLPLALYGGPYFLPEYFYESYGLPYYQTMLFFGPVFPAVAAVMSFFIGIGRTKLILVTTIFANVLNIALDVLFVFGFEPWISPMGTYGAALATVISQGSQFLIFMAVFLSKRNRIQYGTAKCRLILSELIECLRIGVPSSVGHMIEIGAWAVLLQMMVSVSEDHVTAMAIGQSLYSLVSYGIEGLQKAVIAIAANFMGAKKWDMIRLMMKSALKLLAIMGAVFALPMIFYPDPIVNEFLSSEHAGADKAELFFYLKMVSAIVWFYFIVDGITWTVAGVLTAAGDTTFVMLMNAFGAWFFALMPMYFIVVKAGAPPPVAWILICLYGSMNAIFFYWRYRSGAWKNKIQIEAAT